jgi:hypothetical protein
MAETTVIEVDDDWCAFCDTNPDAPAFVQAFVYAKLKSGRTIALCAHHGTLALPKLYAEGAQVIDQRHRLGEN